MQAARQGTPVPEPNIPPSRASWAQPENRAPVPEPSMPPSKASWAEAAIEGTPVPEPNTPVPEPSRPPAANRGTPVPEPSRPPSRDVEWHNDEWHKDEDLVRFGATAAPKASAASKGSGRPAKHAFSFPRKQGMDWGFPCKLLWVCVSRPFGSCILHGQLSHILQNSSVTVFGTVVFCLACSVA